MANNTREGPRDMVNVNIKSIKCDITELPTRGNKYFNIKGKYHPGNGVVNFMLVKLVHNLKILEIN